MSKETKALEDALAAERNTVLSVTEKTADRETALEKASFEKRPAIREELLDLRKVGATARDAVTALEARLTRERFLDARAARRADFEDVNPRAARAGVAARAAVVAAARATSEASVLGRAASAIAVELGGAPAGYVLDPAAMAGIYPGVFESLSHGTDVVRMDEVRWPTISIAVDLPAPGRHTSGLVSSEETEANRAADLELALRK